MASEQQAKVEAKKGLKLVSLTALERVDIARVLSCNFNWRYIGLCFEKSHNFKRSYAELKARHKEDNDFSLCEHLIDYLSDRGITVHELAEALQHSTISMHTIADNLMEQYCAEDNRLTPLQPEVISNHHKRKRSNSADDERKSKKMHIIANEQRLEFTAQSNFMEGESPLNQLASLQLISIAKQCVAFSEDWKKLGLCFEKTHGFAITYTNLKAKHAPAALDLELCKTLIYELAERGITANELFNALSSIGLNLQPTEQAKRHEFQLPAECILPLDNQSTPMDIKELLTSRQQLVIKSEVATFVACDYWNWDKQFNISLWINCSSDSGLIPQLEKLAEWFQISTAEHCITLKDFSRSKIRTNLLRRIDMSPCLLIFYNCNNIQPLQEANMIDLFFSKSRIIICTTTLQLSDSFQPLTYLAWINQPCKEFLSLVTVVSMPIMPASIILHAEGVMSTQDLKTTGLKSVLNALEPLFDKKVIRFNKETASIETDDNLMNYMKQQLMHDEKGKNSIIQKWILILASTNRLYNSTIHNKAKVEVFNKLAELGNVFNKDLARSYFGALIKFIAYFNGDLSILRNSYPENFKPLHHFITALCANIDSLNNDQIVNNDQLESACKFFKEHKCTHQFNLITHWCIAKSTLDIDKARKLFEECLQSVEKGFGLEHPFYIKVKQSYAKRLLLVDNPRALRMLEEGNIILQTKYKQEVGNVALTENLTYLAIATLLAGNQEQALQLFQDSLVNSFCSSNRSFTNPDLGHIPLTMAGLLATIDKGSSTRVLYSTIENFQRVSEHSRRIRSECASYICGASTRIQIGSSTYDFSSFPRESNLFFRVMNTNLDILACWKSQLDFMALFIPNK